MKAFAAISFVLILLCAFFPQDVLSLDLEQEEAYDFGKVTGTENEKEENKSGGIEKEADALYTNYRMKRELYPIIVLSVAQAVFLLIVLFFLMKQRSTANDIVTIGGLTFVIFGTVFVVLVVKTEQQLTAAIGILGTITGYLFGVRKRGKDETVSENEQERPNR